MSSSFFTPTVVLVTLCFCAGVVTGCSSSSEHDQYRVVRKTDAGGKQLVVATEENAALFCQTNVPWKKCWWKPPRNGVRQVEQIEFEFRVGGGKFKPKTLEKRK